MTHMVMLTKIFEKSRLHAHATYKYHFLLYFSHPVDNLVNERLHSFYHKEMTCFNGVLIGQYIAALTLSAFFFDVVLVLKCNLNRITHTAKRVRLDRFVLFCPFHFTGPVWISIEFASEESLLLQRATLTRKQKVH